jgi:TolB-like protein/DNA-binding winged helix-turn-helix (wHTH) protein/Flp pilus assembly protein TadD
MMRCSLDIHMASPLSDNQFLRFGVFELEIHTGELRKSGRLARLRPQAVRVLAMLASSPGQLITREQLREQIWGSQTFVDFEHGLNLCVGEIRAALSDDAESPRYIETLPKRGYRFIASVTGGNLDRPLGDAVAAGPEPAHAIRSRSRAVPLRVAALVVIIAGLVAVLAFADPGQWRERLLAPFAPPIRSVAVLPLENLSGDASQEYFADGMTDALITELARTGTLQVISRTSVMPYKKTMKSLPVIARELKVDAIVEGTVQRSGSHVRVTAQLIRASNDRHLWASTYDGDLSNVLTLQSDVALAIAKQVQGKLGPDQPGAITKPRQVRPEAYEAYLKGNFNLDNGDPQKSIEYFNEAIKLDPDYAPPFAHMARAYFFLSFFSELPPNVGWGKVMQAATTAIEKDESLPEAHGSLALAKLHYDWDWAGAEREFKRALELNPSDADIRHDYAHYLMAMGRTSESAAESDRAVQLDPIGSVLTSCLCWHRFAARQYDQSIEEATRSLHNQPKNEWVHTILGWDYEQKGLYPQAITEFQKAVELSEGDPFQLAALGHAFALAGKRADAYDVLRKLNELSRQRYISSFDVALIYIALGEKDHAFEWLQKAFVDRSTFLIYSKWEPRLDPLRSDPRFRDLVRRIGLPA